MFNRFTASVNAFQTPSWLQHPLTGESKVSDLFDKNKKFNPIRPRQTCLF